MSRSSGYGLGPQDVSTKIVTIYMCSTRTRRKEDVALEKEWGRSGEFCWTEVVTAEIIYSDPFDLDARILLPVPWCVAKSTPLILR